jgi:hypothetical protein
MELRDFGEEREVRGMGFWDCERRKRKRRRKEIRGEEERKVEYGIGTRAIKTSTHVCCGRCSPYRFVRGDHSSPSPLPTRLSFSDSS